MPRREPLNELIVRALEARQRRAEQLKQEKQFQYAKALVAVRAVSRNITNPVTQLRAVKGITGTILAEIIGVCNGTLPEVPDPPTPAQLRAAEARGPLPRWLHPPAPGTGGWAILVAMHKGSAHPSAHANGPVSFTKDEIISLAQRHTHTNLHDATGGFSKWTSVQSLERNLWVKRDALSRRFGGPNGGSWGGAKDRFTLTDEGAELAAHLAAQASGRQLPHPHQQQRAAAAAADGLHGDGDGDDGTDPLEWLLSGPEFVGGGMFRSPAAAAAAAASPPAFTGRGHRLGGGRGGGDSRAGSLGASAATAAAAAAVPRARRTQQVNVGGLLFDVEDDFGFGDPADDAAAAAGLFGSPAARTASRQRSNAPAAAAAGAGARGATQLLPRVRASERPLPLCGTDSACAECASLRAFVGASGGVGGLLHLANLSKAKQQHVRQVVRWLAAPEGGQHCLTVEQVSDKALLLQQQASSRAAAATGAAAGGGGGGTTSKPDVLGALDKLLQPASSRPASSQPAAGRQPRAAAAAAAAGGRQGRRSLLPTDLFGAAAGSGDDEPAGGLLPDSQGGDWLLDDVDLQEQAALLQAAAQARQQQQQGDSPQPAGAADSATPQRQQTPAGRAAAAAAEARMQAQQQQARQQQAQQQQAQRPIVIPETQEEDLSWASFQAAAAAAPAAAPAAPATAGGAQRRPAQQARQPQQRQQQQQPPRPCILLLDESQDAAGLAEAGGAPEPGRSSKRRRVAAAAAAGAPPVCISLLESQDGTDSPAEGVAAADAATRAKRRRQQSPVGHAAAAAAGGSRLRGGLSRHAVAAAAAAAGSGSSAGGFELKLVVDEKERLANPDPNALIFSIRSDHQHRLQRAGVLPRGVSVDVDRAHLPLGDYCWLLLHHDASEQPSDAPRPDELVGDEEEEAAAAERDSCVVAGAVVERKTVRDLVGRSSAGDHLRQLQRMFAVADVVPLQLLLVENATRMAQRCVAYGSGAAASGTVVSDEASLFDLVTRLAVSEQGAVQRVLLAPSPADTRAILLAVTQLLAHQHQHHAQQQQPATTYQQWKSLCSQVSRRLPRAALDPLLGPLPPAPPVPAAAAFAIHRGKGEHAGLQLYTHKTFQALHIVFVEGRQLLTLLDGFFRTAAADCPAIHAAGAGGRGDGGGSSDGDAIGASAYAAVPVLEAVGCAAAVAALLVSHLQGFLAAAGVRLAGEPACCMLLVENVVGAAAHVTQVQHAARMAPGRQAASKQAAARQAEMRKLDGAAVSEWLWLWLVAVVTQHDWHATMAQTAGGVSEFLEAAGSRCCWFAQQEQQQQQRAAAAAGDGGGGGFMEWLSEQPQQRGEGRRPDAAAAAADVIEID